jgi:hypothetical protein
VAFEMSSGERVGNAYVGQTDSAIEEVNRRGRTKTAMATIEGQQEARSSLVETMPPNATGGSGGPPKAE